MVLNSDLAAHHLKASTWEKSFGRNGKIALFRRLETWGEGGLMRKNQLPKILLNHENFQRGKLIVVNHFRKHQSLCYLPLFAEFLMTGWWWGYRKLLQDSCAQPEKEPACQHRLDIRDSGSIHGFRRSPGGEHGNPLQYSCLENPTDRGGSFQPSYQTQVSCISRRFFTSLKYRI